MPSRVSLICVAFLFAVVLGACEQPDPTEISTGRPIAFPSRAYAGETVSFAIHSNQPANFIPRHDASRANTRIRIHESGDTSNYVAVDVRAVISGGISRTTNLAATDAGTEVVVAIFDLPDETAIPFAVPGMAGLLPEFDGVVNVFTPSTPLEILGVVAAGTGPTLFWPSSTANPTAELSMEARPSLRMRAATGFDSTWTVGAIEFSLDYPLALLSTPEPFVTAEADNAVVLHSEAIPGTVRIVLAAPRGMQFGPLFGGLGKGPFLDIAFDKLAAFDTTNFTINNLYVTDLNGVSLIDNPGDSTSFFQLYARAND